jgi:hypothetical protein
MKKIFSILLMALCCASLSANKWRVNNSASVNADFDDLETALQSEDVLAGDTIYVEGSPSTYEITDIVKKVTLIGPGYFLTENPDTQENKAPATIKNSEGGLYLYILADGVVCEGITFDNNILLIGANDVMLKRCWINILNWGNKTTGQQVLKNSVVTQCFISRDLEGNNKNSSADYSDGALVTNNIAHTISYLYNAIIEYNTCIGGGDYAGSISYNNGNGSIRHNVIKYPMVASNNGTMTIDNNYKFESTSFVANSTSSDGKYQLASTSDLKTKAPNGKEVGTFGGASPYILSGTPNVPHIFEIIAPTAASVTNGLDVTVKIATEK